MAYATGTAVGVAAALAATLLVSCALLVQATETRRVGSEHGLRLSLIGRLIRRRRFVAGTLLGYLAFPLQLVALAHAPLILVAPVHAAGLLVVLAGGIWLLRERLGRAELGGAGMMVLGLACVAWGSPTGVEPALNPGAYAAATVALALAGLIPYLMPERCGRIATVTCAGVAFAAVSLAIKGFTDAMAAHTLLVAAGYLCTAALASTAGVLCQMSALQRHPAVDVVPYTYALANFLPVAVAALVLNEQWSSAALSGAPFSVGALLLLAGTAVLARTKTVASLVAGQA